MGRLLGTEYVFRVEVYLIANKLNVSDFESAVYNYNIWIQQQGVLFSKSIGLKEVNGWYRHLNAEENYLFDNWLSNNYLGQPNKQLKLNI